MTTDAAQVEHASAVSVGGRGLLIRGAAGRGKSSLALQMMALGARLVSDDRTVVRRERAQILLAAPEAIAGLIEARGIGLLHADIAPAVLHAVVDLDRDEPERLPPVRHTDVMGQSVVLLFGGRHVSFPAALMQYLKRQRADDR